MNGRAGESATIFARASGAGKAGVAVFRVSGPAAFAVAQSLSGRSITPRRPVLAKLRDPQSGEEIDRGLLILFKGPASFTGEDVAEFHLHGGRAVEAAFAEAALRAGARFAQPGEFTRRALAAGKLDLAQVEALADLIDAETTLQRKQALSQFGGRLSALAEDWRRRLIEVLSPLEAAIDFPDEEGVPAAIAGRAGPAIDSLLAELRSSLAGSARARRLREGVLVAIIGAPNAGKSSLLNALAGSDLAIVSERPGTTRDVIETRLDLGGVPVLIADTAGLRAAAVDDVEAEGIKRTLARAREADLRILVVDPFTDDNPGDLRLPGEAGQGGLVRFGDIIAWSKADLAGPRGRPSPGGEAPGTTGMAVSARTGEGLAALVGLLAERARDLAGGAEGAALTRLRHAEAAKTAIGALERARRRLDQPELAAEDARLAARALGAITGAVDVEDVLDEIFARFCIGK